MIDPIQARSRSVSFGLFHIFQGQSGRQKGGGLIHRAERWNLALQFIPQVESIGGGDNEIAGPVELFRVVEACVQICRKEDGFGKFRPQELQHRELVVDIAPYHADGFYLPLPAFSQLLIEIPDLGQKTADIVILTITFGALDVA